MIDIRNVTKSYGPKVAVQDLTLHVPAGELFAFLGPNGAGKTTTIKMLCGLLFPTSGTVRVGGFDLATHGDQARRARQLRARSAVPLREAHRPRVPPVHRRPVRDAAGEGRGKIDEVIELFHLDEFVDDLTERYSHGMRQRTVFAAALVHEPKLLIADEPTVGPRPEEHPRTEDAPAPAGRRRHDDVPLHAHARHRPGTRRPHRHHRPRPAAGLRHDGRPAQAGRRWTATWKTCS